MCGRPSMRWGHLHWTSAREYGLREGWTKRKLSSCLRMSRSSAPEQAFNFCCGRLLRAFILVGFGLLICLDLLPHSATGQKVSNPHPHTNYKERSTRKPAASGVKFLDVTRALGVQFKHEASPTSQKYLVETMGAGVALIDCDGDGRLDIFFVNGARIDVPMPKGALPVKDMPK